MSTPPEEMDISPILSPKSSPPSSTTPKRPRDSSDASSTPGSPSPVEPKRGRSKAFDTFGIKAGDVVELKDECITEMPDVGFVLHDKDEVELATATVGELVNLFQCLEYFHVPTSSKAKDHPVFKALYEQRIVNQPTATWDPSGKPIQIDNSVETYTCVSCGGLKGQEQIDHQVDVKHPQVRGGGVCKAFRAFGLTEGDPIGYKLIRIKEYLKDKDTINEDQIVTFLTDGYEEYRLHHAYLNGRMGNPSLSLSNSGITINKEACDAYRDKKGPGNPKDERYTLSHKGKLVYSWLRHKFSSGLPKSISGKFNENPVELLCVNSILNYAPKCHECNGSTKNKTAEKKIVGSGTTVHQNTPKALRDKVFMKYHAANINREALEAHLRGNK